MERPFIKFYTRDWQADTALRQCSAAARGVWIEILCLMAQDDNGTRGYLAYPNRITEPLSNPVISRLTGLLIEEVTAGIGELLRNGVCSLTEHGVVYSRRMVKEAEISRINKENGKKGGNPKLKGRITADETPRLSEPDNRKDNPPWNNQNPDTRYQRSDTKDQRKEEIPPDPKGSPPQESSRRFKQPTLEEITSYCAERRNGLDPQAFLDFYDANGWKVGKNQMRDWKAAVRTWEARRRADALKKDSCRSAGEPGKYDHIGRKT